MTVEDYSVGLAGGEDGANDRFPVGMRVLAVDDNPICLKTLEALLGKCQYHVMATNKPTVALNMLRENRNNFDLVISDVDMPDMDGFKLLELVGLEMDLPVIMLSGHSDTKLVMKGISHGACDYLLKPVRIEELKNIWQHVVRKRSKVRTKSSNVDKAVDGGREGGEGSTSTPNADMNDKTNRKRKDQNEDEEDDDEEDDNDNEDPSNQKKPRVVWSVELRRKFVAAVDQLGLEKAVPKKILDMMNVEGITRENVASHLQKYRLFLKKISTETRDRANMVAALGGKDSSYMQTGSLEGFGDFHAFGGTGRFSNTSLSANPAGRMLRRLSSSAGLSRHGITSSGLLQPGPSQILGNSTNGLGKIQSPFLPGNQSVNLYQGLPPTLLDFSHLQQGKPTLGFNVASCYPGTSVTFGGSSNLLPSTTSNPLMLQGNQQQAFNRGDFNNQSTDVGISGFSGSSNFLDHNKYNSENWQSSVHLPKFPSSSLPLNEPFSYDPLPPNDLTANNSSISPHIQNIQIDLISNSVVSAPLENSRGDMYKQAGLIGNVVQKMNYAPSQRWEEQTHSVTHIPNHTFSTINHVASSSDAAGSFGQSMDQRNAVSSINMDGAVIDQLHGGAMPLLQCSELVRSTTDPRMRSNESHVLEQTQAQDGFTRNSYEALDDLMSAMIKWDDNEASRMNGEFGFDSYPLGSCI